MNRDKAVLLVLQDDLLRATLVAALQTYSSVSLVEDADCFPSTSLMLITDDSVRADSWPGPCCLLGGEDKTVRPGHRLEHFALPLRIGALLERLEGYQVTPEALIDDGESIVVGPYDLLVRDSLLRPRAGGPVIRLTEKERDLLYHLEKAGGAVIDRKTLLDAVWGFADGVETHTMETHIYRLRQKIEEDPSCPKLLLTEEPGYRLASP